MVKEMPFHGADLLYPLLALTALKSWGLALQVRHAQGLPAGEVSHCCFPRPLLIKPLLHLVFVRMSLNSGSQLGYLPFLLFPLS